ncbi:hypothetical protein [Streptomyces sp. NPDC055709]
MSASLAINAVLAEDTVLSVPARAGELAALQHLVYSVAMNVDLSEVAIQLIADLKARAILTVDKNHAELVTAQHRRSTGEAGALEEPRLNITSQHSHDVG